MFTGLVESIARIGAIETSAGGRVLRVDTPLGAELRSGDSIAVSGVCLTATATDPAGFVADLSPETLRVTSLGSLRTGDCVNLERPLRADGRIGGHFVLGHVDAVGRIAAVRGDAECHWVDVDVPDALAPLLIAKGSIAVDGISLTIAALGKAHFGVQIVPFTWTHTTLQMKHQGDPVNLEADVIGKYVARLISTGTA
jgi:riboflavin synthase